MEIVYVGNIILTINIRVMTQTLTSEDKDFNHIFPTHNISLVNTA
ncbi:MAG: hypothetical protein QOK72_11605 [Nitrososphaeraceae archaeon]|nr:hypothetical protein [Nitrososphaeraceae archaeon]